EARFLRGNVVLEDRGRIIKGGEGVEGHLVIRATAKTTDGAWSRQRDFILQLAIKTVDVCARGDILQISYKQFSTDNVDDLERLRLLGNDVLPIRLFRMLGIKQEHATVRCLVVCGHQEFISQVVNDTETAVTYLRHDWH